MCLWAVLAMAASCSSTPPRNLVLISIDTLVPGRMSAYGNERPTTPHIDSLLGSAVRFTRAYSPAPWTLPAHASMLTGQYPSSLAPDPTDRRLFQVAPLLSMRFQQRGYDTAAVTGGSFLSRAYKADLGFDYFVEKGDVARATEWLDAHSAEPFFLFFHTYIAHAGYRDRRFVEGMDGGRLTAILEQDLEALALYRQISGSGIDPTPEEARFLRAFYDGGVARADEMVGRLVTTLDDLGVLDRTTIVITSDHGEEFWEHTGRAAYHGHSLYDELLRVPFIWYERGVRGAGKSRRQHVNLIDIVPTVAARFGLEIGEPLDGVDLSPLLEGDDWNVVRPLFAEGVRHGPDRRSVRTAAGKLIVSEGPQRGEGLEFPIPLRAPRELYLADDEAEEKNRFGSGSAIERDLLDALAEREAVAPPPVPAIANPDLDAETREQLEALGYVEP